MKIGLVSSFMKDNDIEYQLEQMEYYLSRNEGCDLLCFGESFLQGFEGLTWDYEEDMNRAVHKHSNVIVRIREMSMKYSCGVSFGFIENDNGVLYSSNMVIGANGDIIDLFRRVSTGWKEPIANEMYQEGPDFHSFSYKDKRIAVAICGDIWAEEYFEKLVNMPIDVLLWPVYIDFSISLWTNKFEQEYKERTSKLPYPTLLVNSYVEDDKRANGGCYIFYKARIMNSLSMGKTGVLIYEF